MQSKIQKAIFYLRKAEDELIETNDIDIKLIRQVKQLIFDILKEIKMKKKQIIKSSAKWCNNLKINPADITEKLGWDNTDELYLHYSFYNQQISKLMFDNRIKMSVCRGTALKYQKQLEDMSK